VGEVSESVPEVWGGGCECWVTPERMWTTHYGAVEPGSQIEFNPDCPSHGTTTTHPTASAGLAGTEGERE